jgi:hypothetical protein
MAEDLFDIDIIRSTLRKAARKPVSFAFGEAAKLPDGKLVMHPKKDPKLLERMLKQEGFKASRILSGTATAEGSTLVLSCEEEVPKFKKPIKYFLKDNQLPQKQVRMMGPNGEFGLEEDDDEPESEAGQPRATAAPGEERNAFKSRIDELAPSVKRFITERGAESKPVAVKFKQALALGKNEAYDQAMSLLEEIGVLLESAPSGQPQADNLKQEWNNRLKKLAPQIKEVLTAKLEGSRDIALKFKEAQALESKQDIQAAIAMLDEVGAMIENLAAGRNKLEAEWEKRFKALEPDLANVLQQGLGDPSKLRAARDMAIEKAGSGDYETAFKILDRLQPAVAQALSSATPPGKEEQSGAESGAKPGKREISPAIAFTQSRLAWNGAREKIQSELQSLEKAILEAARDEDPEIFAEIKGKTSKLYEILGVRNEKLMDKLDEGFNAEKDSPAQIKAYGEASKLVKDYVSFVNGSPLVQEIDANPFKPVAVKKTLDQTLKVLATRLAA